MAGTQGRIEEIINKKREEGLNDHEIFSVLSKRKDRIGMDVAKASAKVGSRSVGRYFGLNLEPQNVNAIHNRDRDISKTQSRLESAAAGLADAGAGIIQGVAYVGDKASEVINDKLGTNLPTDAYEQYNKDYALMNKDIEKGRKGSGREDGDWVRGGTEIAATIPAFALGGGAGAGAKSAAVFAGKQAAIGAGTGATRYADDSTQRTDNMAGGAIGAALGGIAGEKVIAPVAKKGAGMLSRAVANHTGKTAEAATDLVDDAITRNSDVGISPAQKQAMIAQTEKSLRGSKELDGDALINQALLEKHGIKGTQAQINRDPTMWRDEAELAKLSPSLLLAREAKDGEFKGVMNKAVEDTGATANSTYNKMDDMLGKLKESDNIAKNNVNQLYDEAKSLSGNDAQLNHVRFIDQASRELEENGLGSFMAGDIKGVFKGMFDNPDFKLTHAKAEEINKVINKRLGSTTNGNERYALGIIKDNLTKEIDKTIDEMSGMLPRGATGDGLADAQSAWQKARGAARQRFQDIKKTPALKAALDDKNPDKAFRKFVINSDVKDLDSMLTQLRKAPDGDQSIKDIQGAVIEHFLDSATKSNSGAVSPHGINKAITDLGEDRINLLFNPDQVAHINEMKKVADLLFQQPKGSPVNHSNTASAMKYLMSITNMIGQIPVIGRPANLVTGAINTSDNLMKSGKAVGYIDGKPMATKNSTLGLTEKQKNVMKLAEKLSGGRVTAPMGAAAGTYEANH